MPAKQALTAKHPWDFPTLMSPSRGNLACLLGTVFLAAAPSSARAGSWVRFIDGLSADDAARAVAVDGAGHAYVAGEVSDATGEKSFVVASMDTSEGEERWRYEIDAPGGDAGATTITLDCAGDVIAAGYIEQPSNDVEVVKLDGSTGAEIWRRTLAGSSEALDVTTDSGCDVLLVGSVGPGADVVKLDGAAGTTLWQQWLGANARARAVAVDTTGDVAVVGDGPPPAVPAAKLDGATGAIVWTYSSALHGDFWDVAFDSSGDVVAVGTTWGSQSGAIKLQGTDGFETWVYAGGQGFGARAILIDASDDVIAAGVGMAKIDRTTGAEIWKTQTGTAPALHYEGIAFDTTGNILAGGLSADANTNLIGLVATKSDSTTGALLWQNVLFGTYKGNGFADGRAVAADPDGDVIVVGNARNTLTTRDFAAVKFDNRSGILSPVAGRSLSVRDPGLDIQRRLNFIAKDRGIRVPAPGSPDDPRTAGATVRLFNPTTLEEATFFLPGGAAWKGLGNPQGSKGYKYRASIAGACNAVTVVPGKTLKIVCRGKHGTLPFTLDEPSQGSLVASLAFGADAPQCAVFGGTVSKDEQGKFTAKKAPRAAACP